MKNRSFSPPTAGCLHFLKKNKWESSEKWMPTHPSHAAKRPSVTASHGTWEPTADADNMFRIDSQIMAYSTVYDPYNSHYVKGISYKDLWRPYLHLKLHDFWTLPIVHNFKENSEEVQGGRLGVRITIWEKYRLFRKPSGPILGPTHPFIQWLPGSSQGGRATEEWSEPLSSM